jgi:hypothetical protein
MYVREQRAREILSSVRKENLRLVVGTGRNLSPSLLFSILIGTN